MRRVHKAVIPAAGLGTRFLPATKAQPKEMLPIVDTPVIEYAVREAVASGIDDILIVTGRGKRSIEDHFDRAIELEGYLASSGRDELLKEVCYDYGADIHFIRQKNPLGLGHAVLQAARHIGDSPFAVLLADEIHVGAAPCLRQLIDAFYTVGETVVGLRRISDFDVRRYGIAETTGDSDLTQISRLVEKPAPGETRSRLAICGRYILRPEVFDYLRTVRPGVNGEIQLTDALQGLVSGRPIFGQMISGDVYDTGDKVGFLQATVDLALSRSDIGSPFRDFLLKRVQEILNAAGKEAAVTVDRPSANPQ